MFKPKTLIIFALTALLIILLEYDLLKPALEIGLTPEDREFILRYKLLGTNPLSRLWEVWVERGAYTTIPIYYIGIIQSITGFNYQFIQAIGIFFRTLAALSIFPLSFLLFRNLLLSMIATLIFTISYTTTGALETGVEPSEYLGFFLMNIFLIAYYFLNSRYFPDFKWMVLSSSLLFSAVMMSVMRVYPILFLLPLIEISLFLKNTKRYEFKYLCLKLLVLFTPFFLLMYFSPASGSGHFGLLTIMTKILQGNWHLLLTPIQGLGFMIPLWKYYGFFGTLDVSSFGSYIAFLAGGPLVVFGSAGLIISLITAKRVFPFFLRVFLLNFGLLILTYFLVQQRLYVPPDLRLNFDSARLYPILYGLFLFSLMINYFIEWLKEGRKVTLTLALWGGLFFALFFIIMTYFFSSVGLSFGGAQDHYLLIPTMGISLLISAIILLLFEKLQTNRLRILGLLTLIILILFLYFLNREKTYNYFENANFNGRAAAGQKYLQAEIKEILKDLDYSKPVLVYFDTSDIPEGKGPFYSEGLLTPFPIIMYSKGENVINGCIGVIYEDNKKNKLKSMIKVINNKKMITYQTSCVESSRLTNKDILYENQNIYALKITSAGFVDIKDDVLRELDLQ